MKILNLYSGIGGNRKLWSSEHQVTSVELDEGIASIYKKNFPQDELIIGDAHEYLLKNYDKYDFIWSSPPCPTHSRMNVNFNLVRYIDMNLYQEIILLSTYFKGKYCVENVIPYYKPLIPAKQYNRHLFWCNFRIKTTSKKNPPKQIMNIISQKTKRKRKNFDGEITNVKASQPRFGFDLSGEKLKTRKDKILRNCVDPEVGQMILDCALNIIRKENVNQMELF